MTQSIKYLPCMLKTLSLTTKRREGRRGGKEGGRKKGGKQEKGERMEWEVEGKQTWQHTFIIPGE